MLIFDTLVELDFYDDFVKFDTVYATDASDNGRIFVVKLRSSKWNRYYEAIL